MLGIHFWTFCRKTFLGVGDQKFRSLFERHLLTSSLNPVTENEVEGHICLYRKSGRHVYVYLMHFYLILYISYTFARLLLATQYLGNIYIYIYIYIYKHFIIYLHVFMHALLRQLPPHPHTPIHKGGSRTQQWGWRLRRPPHCCGFLYRWVWGGWGGS